MKTMNQMSEKKTFGHKVGDVFERIGEIVTAIGAKGLGSKIYNYGNRLEHKSEIPVKGTKV